MQTSKFLINATAVTLGQDNGKFIQYIFSDLYFFFQIMLSFAQTILTWKANVFAADVDVALEKN